MLANVVTLLLSIQPWGPIQPETLLTPVVDAYPSLSSDGRSLLFQSNRSGRWVLAIRRECSNVSLHLFALWTAYLGDLFPRAA
jgi:hypothetical protein